jgi:hypothetical protein
MNPVSALVAKHHVGDPVAAMDAWKPWRRRKALCDVLAGTGLILIRRSWFQSFSQIGQPYT